MDKLIITVAPTGGFHGKEANPNLPEQPEEIAQAAIECWNEGASIIHIHARDSTGKATGDPNILREIKQRIRSKGCDIVIAFSTGITSRTEFDVRLGVLDAQPEMASLNMGTIVRVYGDEHVGYHPRSRIEKLAERMMTLSIKPEMEVYGQPMMREVHNLVEKGLVSYPLWINFVLGMRNQATLEATPKDLLSVIDYLPKDALFNVSAMSKAQFRMAALSILLGGHIRVGFEDNIYYKKGELAISNAQLVSQMAHFSRDVGRDIASPSEVRSMLGLPKLAPEN